MDLIKELEGFNLELDAWKKGHGWSNKESLAEVADVWLRWQEEKKAQIYGSENHNVIPTDLGCSSCVSDMLSLLYNWREIERPKVKTVSYKAIKEKIEVIEPVEVEVDIDIDGDSVKEGEVLTGTIQISAHPEMSEDAKIAHLRKALNEKGIKWHHKSKAKKLQKQLDEENV